MFRKTITSDFFTTVNIPMFFRTIFLMTIGLPALRYGKSMEQFEERLRGYLGVYNSKIISFYNGRTAIHQALKLIGVKSGDEVIVNGYNCISLSNAILQTGARIIYSDIEKETLSFDLQELEKNITKNTKAIIVQHTFGKPAKIKEIIKLAKERDVIIIEDCAHSLGSQLDGKHLGTFSDFAVFSTSRDKVISSISGGFLLINNQNYFEAANSLISKLQIPSIKLTIKNLMYNIVGYKAYKLYDILNIGKIIIHFSRKLGLITEILGKDEKNCNFNDLNYKLPNSLAYLAKKELEKINKYSFHRLLVAEYYNDYLNKNIEIILKQDKREKLNYFRYPVLLKSKEEKEEFIVFMKEAGVLIGNTWSDTNIAPKGSNLEKAGYKLGTCKLAESISSKLVFLPNHANFQFKKIIFITNLVDKFYLEKRI